MFNFTTRKKTSPELEDKGRVTFRLKGDGAKLTLTYNVEQKPEDKVPSLMKGNVNFDISDLDIDFDTSTIEHTVLVPMLKAIFKPQIKLQLEKEVEKSMKSWINKLGELYDCSNEQTFSMDGSGYKYH